MKRALIAPVGVIGCSNSRDMELAYRAVSANPITWSAARYGCSIVAWGQNLVIDGVACWDYFDSLWAPETTAVFWPICEHVGDHATLHDAMNDFKLAVAQLRQRTSVPLYVTPHIAAQETCPIRQAWMDQISSVALDAGITVPPVAIIPAASAPLPNDSCHFDPILSTNVGLAVRSFMEGIYA